MWEPDPFFRRPPRPMRVVKEAAEENQRRSNAGRRQSYVLIAVAALLLFVVVLFPRVLAFLEVAARELRYLWWLVLIGALGIWLAFFFRRPRE